MKTDRNVRSIHEKILLIRGQRVIIDADLAGIYGTTTRALNQAVKRNINRFPSDFMFQLNESEKLEVVTNCDHLSGLKYSRIPPYAFTEHGAIMAASILNSNLAVQMSLFVVRAFVRMREVLSDHRELSRQLNDLEQLVGKHDEALRGIIMTIKQLMNNSFSEKNANKIGFDRQNNKKE